MYVVKILKHSVSCVSVSLCACVCVVVFFSLRIRIFVKIVDITKHDVFDVRCAMWVLFSCLTSSSGRRSLLIYISLFVFVCIIIVDEAISFA